MRDQQPVEGVAAVVGQDVDAQRMWQLDQQDVEAVATDLVDNEGRHVLRQIEAVGEGLDSDLPGADGAERDLSDQVGGGRRQARVVEHPAEESVGVE